LNGAPSRFRLRLAYRCGARSFAQGTQSPPEHDRRRKVSARRLAACLEEGSQKRVHSLPLDLLSPKSPLRGHLQRVTSFYRSRKNGCASRFGVNNCQCLFSSEPHARRRDSDSSECIRRRNNQFSAPGSETFDAHSGILATTSPERKRSARTVASRRTIRVFRSPARNCGLHSWFPATVQVLRSVHGYPTISLRCSHYIAAVSSSACNVVIIILIAIEVLSVDRSLSPPAVKVTSLEPQRMPASVFNVSSPRCS
jgi:hypothetical protein